MPPASDASSPQRIATLVQAYLFSEGGALSFKRLMQLTGTDHAQLVAALDELSTKIAGSGLTLVRNESEAMLAVASDQSDALRAQYEKELGREIGEAGLEVLAILLYRSASTRAEIDYIRGVNTSSTIRTLLARGLIERSDRALGGREYSYGPTVELLAHLGATNLQDVPEYATIGSELRAFEDTSGPFTTATSEHYEQNTTEEELVSGVADDTESVQEEGAQ